MKLFLLFFLLLIFFLLILSFSKEKFFENNPNHIIVISLTDSLERRKKISKIFDNVKFEFFNAVKGNNLTKEQLVWSENHTQISNNPGMLGCLMSHVFVWTKIKNEHLQKTLVLEDDIVRTKKLTADEIFEITTLPKVTHFDTIYLGHCYESVQNTMNKIDSNSTISVYKSEHPWCTHAYIISYAGACKLLDYININRILTEPVDVIMSNAIKENVITSFSVYPTVFDQDGGESTIHPGKGHPWFAKK